jgi:ubiquinone biosynthesis protein
MGWLSRLQNRYKSFVRYNQILRVFVRYGFEEMVSYMIATGRYRFIRRLIPSTTKKNAQKYTRWEKMRLVCEELGPTFVKFGQILSNRADLLPKELIIQLEKLQDNVPPFDGEIALQLVESEFNKPIDQLFFHFDKNAFASASMAQVHKAILKNGERIVLKIQRPNIRKIIIEDIKVMYTLADIFAKRIPTVRAFDPRGLVKNFEESILKELDFIHESVNANRFAKNIENDSEDQTTYTIKVYKKYTTQKILALEFVQGIKITDSGRLKLKGFNNTTLAKKLAISYIKQVFEYGFFHADPHPGNILIMESGDVCFLDFGMMGSIMKHDIKMFGLLFLSVKEKDIRAIIKALQMMSDNTVVRDMRGLEFAINEFVQSYSFSDYHENEMSTILIELKDVIIMHGLKVPPHFFLLARSMVTIEGVIHHLDPKLDLLQLARPYLMRTIRKEFNVIAMAKKMAFGLYDLGTYMEDFPLDLKNAIRKINSGTVQVDLTHRGIDPMVHTINRVTKQVILTFTFIGLSVGCILCFIYDVPPHWGSLSFYGFVCLMIAIYLGLKIFRDLKKGDHDDWSGWNHN